jgi:hypothetical protein
MYVCMYVVVYCMMAFPSVVALLRSSMFTIPKFLLLFRAALHKESRPSKVGAVSTKILTLMAPGSASSGHFNKSITGAKTLVCKGLGAKESRPLYKALKI